MRGESTPHKPHSNQYYAKGLSCQIIITLYKGAGEIRAVSTQDYYYLSTRSQNIHKTRGEEKINLPNKAHDTC